MLGLLLVVSLAGCDAVSADEEDADASSGEAPAMDAPSGLAAVAADGTVELAWDGVDGAAGYHVYRGTASFTDLGEATTVSGDSPLSEASYADDTAANGTTYYYRVTAAGEDDAESEASDEVAATPLPDPPDRP
jgi:fibronectin type 3 domain-containing protein